VFGIHAWLLQTTTTVQCHQAARQDLAYGYMTLRTASTSTTTLLEDLLGSPANPRNPLTNPLVVSHHLSSSLLALSPFSPNLKASQTSPSSRLPIQTSSQSQPLSSSFSPNPSPDVSEARTPRCSAAAAGMSSRAPPSGNSSATQHQSPTRRTCLR
jgi:hypothetical protein